MVFIYKYYLDLDASQSKVIYMFFGGIYDQQLDGLI